jgi:hypothetical protein
MSWPSSVLLATVKAWGARVEGEGKRKGEGRNVRGQMERTYVILRHLGAYPVAGALNVLDGVLDLVRRRDVLPRVQEGFLLHRACWRTMEDCWSC